MTFRPLTPVSSDDHLESVPWCNQWVKGRTDFKEEKVVMFCQVYDTGIAVVCKDYKGYLHEGSSAHDHLLEALNQWMYDKGETFVLKVRANKKGKIEVGVEPDEYNHRWNYSENRYTQIPKKSGVTTESVESSNPLLAGRGVRSTVGKTEGSTSKAKKEPS